MQPSTVLECPPSVGQAEAIGPETNRGLLDGVGLNAELRDAKTESGFSFSDMCANLAGIRFAQRVLAGELPLAELAGEFRVDAHLPDVGGLPDGLSKEDFRDRYGSIAEPRFTDVLVEIRGRIERLHGGSMIEEE